MYLRIHAANDTAFHGFFRAKGYPPAFQRIRRYYYTILYRLRYKGVFRSRRL
jgi:hypothetical protein